MYDFLLAVYSNFCRRLSRTILDKFGVKQSNNLEMSPRSSTLSFTVFRTFYIHGHKTAFMWCDCRLPWWYFKVIRLFHIKFLKNGAWYGKSYYWPLIGNHTLAFDWCHFWWPSSTFEVHFSLGCHFHVHFSNPWHAFASHGLPDPAIAELLVLSWKIYCSGGNSTQKWRNNQWR